jgi:hypothetical protein
MVWNAAITWTTGQTVTAAQLNAQIRDNFNETAPAKATTAGWHFVSAGTNSIAERAILASAVDTTETTTSTSYVDLTTPGPTVTMTTGPRALVFINCQLGSSNTSQAVASYGVSGATTLAPADTLCVLSDNQATGASGNRMCVCDLRALTAGSNTFYMSYRMSAAGTGSFLRRRIQVMGL